MAWIPNQLLLAVDLGGMIWAVIMVIGFLSWLIQTVSSKNRPPPPVVGGRPAQQPARRGGDGLQNEIDLFLKEVGGRKKTHPEEVPIEILPNGEIRAKNESTHADRGGRKPLTMREDLGGEYGSN